MSVREPASLDHTSMTSPRLPWRMAPISESSGPGQAMPRASMSSVACVVVAMSLSSIGTWRLSDEHHRARRLRHEGGDPLDAVDQRVELCAGDAECVHRLRAGVDVDLADLLGLGEQVG